MRAISSYIWSSSLDIRRDSISWFRAYSLEWGWTSQELSTSRSRTDWGSDSVWTAAESDCF